MDRGTLLPIEPTTRRASGAPRELGDRDLPTLIEGAGEPVVLESYFAGWERPWRALSEESWAEITSARGERIHAAPIGALIETGRNRETAVRFGLEIVPNVLVFLGGRVVARFSGRVSAAEVLEAVRVARDEARGREVSALELEALAAAHEPVPSSRTLPYSILRRFAAESERPLVRVG